MRKPLLNASVISREELTDGLFAYRILPDAGVPDFLPGQYLALGVEEDSIISADFSGVCPSGNPGLVKRAYSIASSPGNRDYLEFLIDMIPFGTFTSRLLRMNAGARLYVANKAVGVFTLSEVSAPDHVIMVATGTGIAPFMSMLRAPDTFERCSRITLVCGASYKSRLAYQEELESIESRDTRFHYLPVVSREVAPVSVIAGGHVQDVFMSDLVPLNPSSDRVFLCGNPFMIAEMRVLLEGRGFNVHSRQAAGNIHMEKFWQD